jgi:diguanylate cyclase (GGDEF)-like protein
MTDRRHLIPVSDDGLSHLVAYKDFATAGSALLRHLHQRLGFRLWMITRTEGNDWIVLDAVDEGYGIRPGDVYRWSDSLCSRMVTGQGPMIAPRAVEIPAYLEAGLSTRLEIGAYVGMPLLRQDGRLFGTLCAMDPSSMPATIEEEQPWLELSARLLSTLLEQDLKAHAERRRAEQAEAESWKDAPTGLKNRRAWDHLMSLEEARCRRYGHTACVIAVDLGGEPQAKDAPHPARKHDALRKAAVALRLAVRQHDVLARVGDHAFGILAVECDAGAGHALMTRLRHNLAEAGIQAACGLALRNPVFGLYAAWEEADAAMREVKQRQDASRSTR